MDPDIHFRVLNILEKNPSITQRELSNQLSISLGGVNYCLKALIKIGHVKVQNFQKSTNKSMYLYLLTQKGIAEKTNLMADFLKRKMAEYHMLKREIDSIRYGIRNAENKIGDFYE